MPRWREIRRYPGSSWRTRVMKQATAKRLAKASRNRKNDKTFDVRKLKLVPVLKRGKAPVTVAEVVRRGRANPATNWGKREMDAVWKARESFPTSAWPVGKCVFFTKMVWRDRDGSRYVWCVGRDAHGWYRNDCWLGIDVGAGGLLPSLRE
ncbi:MAG: hypothetical protein HYW56_00550 [Candidatus Harrisonbacteria bacterium]|nr:hypothetical protein [Candidatus Harrisonbacteria bacterium]